MRILKNNKIIFPVLIGIALILFIIPLIFTLPGDTFLWGEIQNFGHTPLFGILAVILLFLSKMIFSKRFKRQISHYYVAFITAAFLGGMIEIVQMYTNGDPDIYDFVRDLLGAGAFLVFYMYFDQKMILKTSNAFFSSKSLPLIVSIVLILISLTPAILLAGAYLNRNLTFPMICDFDSCWEWRFIGTSNARLTSSIPPLGWNKSPKDKVGRLDFNNADSAGFYIQEPGLDWGAYKYFDFSIYSPLDSTLKMNLGIEDFLGKDTDDDRFHKVLYIHPGLNEFEIPIEEISSCPLSRKLDLGILRDIYFVALNTNSKISLYFDDLKLSGRN